MLDAQNISYIKSENHPVKNAELISNYHIFPYVSHVHPHFPRIFHPIFSTQRYGLLVAMHSYGLGGKPLGSVAKFTELCRELLGEAAMPSEEHLVCGSLALEMLDGPLFHGMC